MNSYGRQTKRRPKKTAYLEDPSFIEEYQKLKGTITNEYRKSTQDFSAVFLKWLPVRRESLDELRSLVYDLHNEQLKYNKAQKGCREIGLASRTVKTSEPSLEGVASFFAFLSDAASGVLSVVEACNVDTYQKKFQEIMEKDSEATKYLYQVRSRCLGKYQGIEEVVRKFQLSTFDSTVDNISSALKVEKFWIVARNADGSDDLSKMMTAVGGFIENAFESKTLRAVCNSVETYVENNPATLDACKSAARVVVGVMDSVETEKKEGSELRRGVSRCAHHLMIRDDRREIARLQSTIDNDSSQNKLEAKMKDAIDSMQSEMDEITEIYSSMSRWR